MKSYEMMWRTGARVMRAGNVNNMTFNQIVINCMRAWPCLVSQAGKKQTLMLLGGPWETAASGQSFSVHELHHGAQTQAFLYTTRRRKACKAREWGLNRTRQRTAHPASWFCP